MCSSHLLSSRKVLAHTLQGGNRDSMEQMRKYWMSDRMSRHAKKGEAARASFLRGLCTYTHIHIHTWGGSNKNNKETAMSRTTDGTCCFFGICASGAKKIAPRDQEVVADGTGNKALAR